MLNNTSVLTLDLILFAAPDCCPTTDLNSPIYADLWAIEACASKSFLPWTEDLENYPCPEYLLDIVDVQTGNINQKVLLDGLKYFVQMPICNIGFNLKTQKKLELIDEFYSIQLTGNGAVATVFRLSHKRAFMR